MNQYQWRGLNRFGEPKEGTLILSNRKLAKMQLIEQGILVQKIRKKRTILWSSKIKYTQIVAFYHQIATLVQAGIPLLQSLDSIHNLFSHSSFKNLIVHIKHDIERGLSLTEALQKHPRYFSTINCHLVHLGENTGNLDVILGDIAHHEERILFIQKKIKTTLIYPCMVLTIALLVACALFIWVVPQFQSLFNRFDADLPPLTRTVIAISSWLGTNWMYIASSLIGLFLFLKRVKPYAKWKIIESISFRLPWIGNTMQNAVMARFARTLSITLKAGLPLLESLTFVAASTGRILFTQAVLETQQSITKGETLYCAMKHTTLFPEFILRMVAIGEASGTLDAMLSKAAQYYEESMANATNTLSNLLEPVIMAILGLVIGFFIIAMYIPMFKLGSVM